MTPTGAKKVSSDTGYVGTGTGLPLHSLRDNLHVENRNYIVEIACVPLYLASVCHAGSVGLNRLKYVLGYKMHAISTYVEHLSTKAGTRNVIAVLMH